MEDVAAGEARSPVDYAISIYARQSDCEVESVVVVGLLECWNRFLSRQAVTVAPVAVVVEEDCDSGSLEPSCELRKVEVTNSSELCAGNGLISTQGWVCWERKNLRHET